MPARIDPANYSKGWPQGAFLPAEPLLAKLDAWFDQRPHLGRQGVLGTERCRTLCHIRADGKVSLRLAEELCDQFGWHPFGAWGEAYVTLADELADWTPPRRNRTRRRTA